MNSKTFVVVDQESEKEYFSSEREEEAQSALLDLVDEGIAAYIYIE